MSFRLLPEQLKLDFWFSDNRFSDFKKSNYSTFK
jgi:hypothetical protein